MGDYLGIKLRLLSLCERTSPICAIPKSTLDVTIVNFGDQPQVVFVTNLHPGVAKTLGVPKAIRLRLAITSYASLHNTHASPNVFFFSAISLPYMFCSLIACGEGRSWRSEWSWRNDEFSALFSKKQPQHRTTVSVRSLGECGGPSRIPE
jgi:hypothetical protein